MAQDADGWDLLGRIAAQPAQFSACDKTAMLAALLLVRNQLMQGVTDGDGFGKLAALVGEAAMIEVIENLAAYEALRVFDNILGADALGEKRTAAAARRKLVAAVKSEAEKRAGAAPAVTSLHHNSAMGARRIRSADAS